MKRSRFSEEQIIGILKEHQAGLSAAELCRKHGISDATFYNWRSKYGGMEASEAKRLKALEEENRKLKKLLAESMLDVATLKELSEKTSDARSKEKRRDLGDRREDLFAGTGLCADWACAEDLSLSGKARSRRGGSQTASRTRWRAPSLWLPASASVAVPGREDIERKKLYRLYKEERLTVRKRGGRKRALGTRAPMAVPQGINQRWSLDFVSDALTDSRRFRILAVIDDFNRECLCLVADISLSGVRVARELDKIAELRGHPCLIVSDNGADLERDPEMAGGTPSRMALHRAW